MVEYLLMLVLTVGLVLAISRGVGQPLQNYIRSNITGVMGCMLRVGELPHIAYDICSAPSNIRLNADANITSAPPGGGGGNSQNSSDSSDSGADEGSGGGGSSGGSGGGSPSFSNSNSTGAIRRGSGAAGALPPPTKVISLNEEEGGDSSFKTGELAFNDESGSSVVIKRIKKEDRIGGGFSISKDQEGGEQVDGALPTKRSVANPKSLSAAEDEGGAFDIPKEADRGPAKREEEEINFSFVVFIKWIIIIAVIIAFLVFMGNQLNSIRKGWTD